MSLKKFLILLCLCFTFCSSYAQKSFKELSLEEKIGQTLFVYADVNNAERLCHSMEKAQDKDLYDRLVADAYDYVKSHYSSDVIVDKTIQIYKKYLTE